MTSGENTPSPSSRRKIDKKTPAAKNTPREKELEVKESEVEATEPEVENKSEVVSDEVVSDEEQESPDLAPKEPKEESEESEEDKPEKSRSSRKNFYDENGKTVFYTNQEDGFKSVHTWTERRQEFTETKLHKSEQEAEEWCLNRVPVS
jgi:hypothetical protein